MSSAAKAYVDDLRIPIPARHDVMRYMADRLNALTGRLNPRVDTICRDLGHSKRTVLYHLKWAVEAGILERRRQARGRANRYTLHVGRAPAVPVDAPCIRARSSPNSDQFGLEFGPAEVPDRTLDCTSEAAAVAPQIAPGEPEENNPREGEPSETRACARDPLSLPDVEISAEEVEAPADEEPTEASPEVRQSCIDSGLDPADFPEELLDVERGRRRRRLVPEQWQPSADDRAYVQALGHDPDRMRDKFVFKTRGRGIAYADFSAGFKHWALTEREPVAAKPSRVDVLRGLVAKTYAMEAAYHAGRASPSPAFLALAGGAHG